MLSTNEIIELLGGKAAVANLVRVKVPSIYGWIEQGSIPEGRLIQLGALIEFKSNQRITRKLLRPDDWQLIWPELAD